MELLQSSSGNMQLPQGKGNLGLDGAPACSRLSLLIISSSLAIALIRGSLIPERFTADR